MDIENLLACPRPTRAVPLAACHQYRQLAEAADDDLIVVACNHGAALAVGTSWDPARLVVRSGVAGADLALLEVLHSENIADRFDSVVIAAGDGIFAEAAAKLAGSGVDVTVVSRPTALSIRLRLAAKSICYFDSPIVPEPASFGEVAA